MENYFLSQNTPSLSDLYQKNYRAPLFYRHIHLEEIFYIVRNVMHNAWGKGVYTWNSHKNSF